MPTPTVPLLDHIVILVPHTTLRSLPHWLTNSLTVLPGGTHAGGATENKLVLFHDGVYLELIAFTQNGRREDHRWGHRPEGRIIDWALSLSVPTNGGGGGGSGGGGGGDALPEDGFPAVQARVHDASAGAIVYGDPVAGGRVRPDGVVLEWAVAAPGVGSGSGDGRGVGEGAKLALETGELPFWCFDRTPRARRVPYREHEGQNAEHPSGVVGVAKVSVSVRDEELFRRLGSVYAAIYGEKGQGSEGSSGNVSWHVETPGILEGGKNAVVGLVLNKSLQDESFVEIALYTRGKEESSIGGSLAEGQQIEIKLVPL